MRLVLILYFIWPRYSREYQLSGLLTYLLTTKDSNLGKLRQSSVYDPPAGYNGRVD